MSSASSLSYRVASVGGGSIAIGHRPRIKHLRQLKADGFTHLVTILSEKEGALNLGDCAKGNGLEWIWLAWGTSAPSEDEEMIRAFRERFALLEEALKMGGKVYVHCSAGIHRTATFVLGLLTHLGYGESEAKQILESLRPETFHQVGDDRLRWAIRLGTWKAE